MKNLKLVVIMLAAAALLQTPADARKGDGGKIARKTPNVNVSGAYTGQLKGTISIGSEMVVVAKNAIIMDGQGNRLEPGASVSRRCVSACGQMQDGKLLASLIVVGEPVSDKDFSEETLSNVIADPDRAR